jgi:hypothetical protein
MYEQPKHPARNDRFDWRSPSRYIGYDGGASRKLAKIWKLMLKPKKAGWSVKEIATGAGANLRFVQSYVTILAGAGYLVQESEGRPGHDPRRYNVGTFYREDVAPQMAGGSAGGKRLGNGWNAAPGARGVITRSRRPASSAERNDTMPVKHASIAKVIADQFAQLELPGGRKKKRPKRRPPAKKIAASKRRRAAVAKKNKRRNK